jgi:hypothetical protein
MSPGGGPRPDPLNAFGSPTLDGGGSSSTYVEWSPFNVLLITYKEHKMRANLDDGGRSISIGGPCNDVP